MLGVQKYLRCGKTIENLCAEFSIKARVDPALGVVSLNYDQINSVMSLQIVQECRALILELDTWEVLSWPFKKFFNYGEGHIPEDFDWGSFSTLEKLDGSLISLWFKKVSDTPGPLYQAYFSTRSVPDANCGYDESGDTFLSLIKKTIVEMEAKYGNYKGEFLNHFMTGYSYAFELTTPENQIVVQHNERCLTLIGVRDLETLEEVDIYEWARDTYPYPVVKGVMGLNLEAVKQKVSEINPLDEEGYVLIDENFNRIKIKSDAYLLLSRSRDNLGKSARARLEIILIDKMDDVWPIQPKWIQEKLTSMKEAIRTLALYIDLQYVQVCDIEGQKDFALEIKGLPYKDALFQLRSKKVESAIDWVRNYGLKNSRKLLDLLKIVVEDLDDQESEES
jgi:hypothetical protein